MSTPIEKYKEKVVEYQKYLMECHERYGDRGMASPMEFFDDPDYDKVRQLSQALSSIEDVLAIDATQAGDIWEECKVISGLVDTWSKKD